MMINRIPKIIILLRFAHNFVGAKVAKLAAVSILLGFALFFVELLFAFSIQKFFNVIGVDTPSGNSFFKDFSFASVTSVIILLILVSTLRSMLVWWQTYTSGITTVEFEAMNRKRIVSWALTNRSARLAEVTTLFNDVTIASGNFISSLMAGLSRLVVAILLAFALFKLSYQVTFFIFTLLAFLYFPLRAIANKIRHSSNTIHFEIDGAIERLLRGVKNSLFLHVYGLYRQEESYTHSNLNSYLKKYKVYHFYTSLKSVLPQMIGIWLLCVILLISRDYKVLAGALLIQYFYLFIRFVQSLGEIANLLSYISLTKPRIKKLWDWWISLSSSKEYLPLLTEGAISFNNPIGWKITELSFRYPGGGIVLNNLTVSIQPGSALVITGPSGSGKSTFISLLLGLSSPTAGIVEIFDGKKTIPLEKCRSSLLASMGYVGPDSFIIPGTIRDNLLYGNATHLIEESDFDEALKLSGCSFVKNLPGNLSYELTEQGEGLSAGQKQRLALARALLRKPKVLILDEATSNLDAATESALVDTLIELKSYITIVAVTHRDALLKIADHHLTLNLINED